MLPIPTPNLTKSKFGAPRASASGTLTMEYERGKTDIFEYLNATLTRRVMVLDGAMGTLIQVRGDAPAWTAGAPCVAPRSSDDDSPRAPLRRVAPGPCSATV